MDHFHRKNQFRMTNWLTRIPLVTFKMSARKRVLILKICFERIILEIYYIERIILKRKDINQLKIGGINFLEAKSAFKHNMLLLLRSSYWTSNLSKIG